MPVSLNPDAQNQPGGLLARVRNTRYRLEHFGATPTPLQIQGLGSVLAMETQEAYRLALQREALKWGVSLYGPLDPFVKTRLEATAQTRATGIVSTYLRNQAEAQKQGKDLKSWQEHYASWKAPQVMQHEYASADARAVQEFYSSSRTPDGKLLEAQGRVLPLHTAVDDDCRLWVERGWMPLDEALTIMSQLPLHPGCPHMMMVLPGSSMINADDLEDNPEPTEATEVVPPPDWASSPDDSVIPLGSPVPTGLGQTNAPHPSYVDSEVGSAMTGSYPQGDPSVFLPNTTKLLALPSISLRSIRPHLLLDTLFTAGMIAALRQPPPPPAQGQP